MNTILSDVAFQFHKVRLKVTEIAAFYNGIRSFQFHKVRLKES